MELLGANAVSLVQVLTGVLSALTAVAALLVAPRIQHTLGRRALEHRLRAEYELEQRRELRRLIGRYHGRLVEAADSWRHRMENLFEHQAEGRLDVGGRYEEPDYYFGTTVYRFLTLATLARQFEGEAFHLDARIAERSDLEFLKYVKAFRWVMTDLELVEGLPYDPWGARDHFLTDRYRGLCDAFAPEGELPSLAAFEARAGRDAALDAALCFFDGLRADEPRLRWDRVVALQLLVIAFLDTFGYDMQRPRPGELERAVAQLRRPEVGANLAAAIERLGLGEQEQALRVSRALLTRPDVAALARRPPATEPGSVPTAVDV